jgi:protein-S-isoprenylcysteine O-methyltransferase Ste14
MGGTIWTIQSAAGQAMMYGLFACGVLLVLVSTFLINHFDLFGLRQIWLCLKGKEYTQLNFATPGPYRMVRHPLYVGWILTFWCTPTMTVTHLIFALGLTAHILIAIFFEERNLVDVHGVSYANYRKNVPMLIPGMKRKTPSSPEPTPATSEST